MGLGYRYWRSRRGGDGFREDGLLNFGKRSQIACTIEK